MIYKHLIFLFRKHDVENVAKDKQTLVDLWKSCDTNDSEEMKYHLISRKWLTQFIYGDEAGPIDNSDAVCPHGFIVPFETVHFGATWIPHPVWELLMERYFYRNYIECV